MIRSTWRRARDLVPSLARRLARGPAILLYHRIAARETDPFALCVPPELFVEHLRVLRRDHELFSLAELCARARDGTLPRGGVAITFDDGYRDNLLTAAPLLARFGVPATFFIATGQTGQSRGFWWDELARAVLESRGTAGTLDLRIGGRGRVFDASADGVSRACLFATLYELMIGLPQRERLAMQDRVLAWAGLSPEASDEDRALDADELRALAAFDGVEIGAHSVTHNALPGLTTDEQLAQMRESRSTLEEIVGRRIRGFAYPYGTHTRATAAAARRAGFEHACTCLQGRIGPRSDFMRLPRLEVRACTGEELSRALRRRMAGHIGRTSPAGAAVAAP
jgi:peptidoglycan/xylan/chitin deacetylase (PgdA/CDA1 family)